MDLVSRPNTILFHGKHRNNEVYRICQGVVLPYFGLMGYVSSWAQLGRILGLEHDPSTVWSSSTLSYTYIAATNKLGFVLL
jgi:hypothetical protein